MNLETKITIYKFTPQVFTLTPNHICKHANKYIHLCIKGRIYENNQLYGFKS